MNWKTQSLVLEPTGKTRTESNTTTTTATKLAAPLISLTQQDLTGKPRRRTGNSYQPIGTRLALTLHIDSLHLHIIDYIKENMLGDIYVKIIWKFLKYKQSSLQKIGNQPLVIFDNTSKYLLQMSKTFFERIRTEPLKFEMYVHNDSEELLLSRANVYFGSHFEDSVNVTFVGTDGDNERVLIGKLCLWYEFSKSALQKLEAEEAEVEADVAKTLRGTQSEMSHDKRRMVNQESQKKAWKQTLQRNTREQTDVMKKMSSVKHVSTRFSRLNYRMDDDFPKLTINLKKLRLFPGKSLVRNEAIKKIYIEYEFLNYSGPDMEMPHSLAKPKENEWLAIDFVKAFPVHLENNYEICKTITAMIKNCQCIRLSIVSEPIENPRLSIQTCKEVGFAQLSIGELVEQEADEYEYEYNVFDTENTDDAVGGLVVRFGGIVALKKLALTLWHL